MIRILKHKNFLQSVALVCIAAILNCDYAATAASQRPPQGASDHVYSTASASKTTDTYEYKPMVFLIEDAHCVPSVQQSISNTLNELYANHSVEKVFIEGCSGEQDFQYLRLYPLTDERDKTLHHYLEKGIISGVEYFASTLPAHNRLEVTGIEDGLLYSHNRRALRAVSNQVVVHTQIQQFIKSLHTWLKEFGSEELVTILDKIKNNNVIQLVDYLIAEYGLSDATICDTNFAELKSYFECAQNMSEINLDRVFAEANNLLHGQTTVREIPVSAETISNRIAQLYMNPHKSNTVDSIIVNAIADNDNYRFLHRYLLNNILLNEADLSVIDQQINRFIEYHLYSLCRSEMDNSVVRAYITFQKVDRLIELKFTASEAVQYINKPFIDALVENYNDLPSNLSKEQLQVTQFILPAVFEAMDFYRQALDRDQAIHNNFLTQYQTNIEPCAVVMGGFHSSRFVKFLETRDIPVTVIKPDVAEETVPMEKVYYQHFMNGFDTVEPVYNQNSLGTQPIMSATSQGQLGPSAVWFNQILGELADTLRPAPQLGKQWIQAITATLQPTLSRMKNLIIALSIAALLGIESPALSQPTPQVPAVQPPTIQPAITVRPAGLTQQAIDTRLAAYENTLSLKRSIIMNDLESGVMALQVQALKLLVNRGDYGTMFEVFKTTTSKGLREIIIGQAIINRRYATLADMFLFFDTELRQAKEEITLKQEQARQAGKPVPQIHVDEYLSKSAQMFDHMIMTTVTADPRFIAEITNIHDTQTRQRLKYMLTYYIEGSQGREQEILLNALYKITDLSQLYGIYISYSDDLPLPPPGQVQYIFDPNNPTIFYQHTLKVLRDFALHKLLENSLVARLDKVIERASKELSASFYIEDEADAQTLLQMYKTGDPAFIDAFHGYFPDLYQAVDTNLERKIADAAAEFNLSPPQHYPHEFALLPSDQFVQFLNNPEYPFKSDSKLVEWYTGMGVYIGLDYFIFNSSDDDLVENVIRRYYPLNMERLMEFYEYFVKMRRQQLSQVAINLMYEAFLLDPEKYFNLKQYNPTTRKSLLLLARHQERISAYPSVRQYLFDNIPSDFTLAAIHETQEVDGLMLTQDELQNVETALARRFIVQALKDQINELQLKEKKHAFSDRTRKLNEIQTELNLIQSKLVSPQEVIAEYDLDKQYKKWRKKMHDIFHDQYQRPHVFTKVFNLSLLPIAATGAMILLSYILMLFGLRGFKFHKKHAVASTDSLDKTKATEVDDRLRDYSDIRFFLTDFVSLHINDITYSDLEALNLSVQNINSHAIFLLDIELLNGIFSKLYRCSNNTAQNVEFRNFARHIFKRFQQNVSSREHDKQRLFVERKDPRKQNVPVAKLTFSKILVSIFTFGSTQKDIIKLMNKLIDMTQFTDNFRALTRRLAMFRLIYLISKIAFFSVLAVVPIIDPAFGFVSLSLVILFQTFDIFLYFLAIRGNDEIRDWFKMQFSRVAKFDMRIEFEKAAEAVAEGETARWTVTSIWINIIGAFTVVSVISPWFLIPYITITLLMFFIWKKMIGEESDVYVKKSEFYAPLFGTVAKIVIPAIGLSFGFLLQAFIVTNLYEAMIQFGSGQFLRVFSQSVHQLNSLRALLDDIISSGHVISDELWYTENPVFEERPAQIDSFDFQNVTSSIYTRMNQPVVENVNLHVKRAELVYINAVSGMGKSTLGRLLAHYSKTTTGTTSFTVDKRRYEVTPENISHKALRNTFNYLKFDHIPHLSAKDILEDAHQTPQDFVVFVRKFLPDFSRQNLDTPLDSFPINEKKFLMLAMYYFINTPTFLVLDDLFVDLTEETAKLTMDFLNHVRQHNGTSIVVIDEQLYNSLVPEFDNKYAFTAGKLISYKEKLEFAMWQTTNIDMPDPNGVENGAAAVPRVSVISARDDDNVIALLDPQGASVEQWMGSGSVKEYMCAIHELLPVNPADPLNTNQDQRKPVIAIAQLTHLVMKYFLCTEEQTRTRMYMQYQRGSEMEQMAAHIISQFIIQRQTGISLPFDIANSNQTVNYVVNNALEAFGNRIPGADALLARFTQQQIGTIIQQELRYNLRWPAIAFMSDVITYIHIFAAEDTPHRLKLWQDYTNSDKDSAEYVAGVVITRFLRRYQIDFQGPLNELMNTEVLAIQILDYISRSERLAPIYGVMLRETHVEVIARLITQELESRRTLMIAQHFAQQIPHASRTLNNKSLYELWGIKMLFEQFNVQYSLLPKIIDDYTYPALRGKFFIIRDAGAPITLVTLQMDDMDQLRSYATQHDIWREFRDLNAEPVTPVNPADRFRPTSPLLDNAA